jgi:hypothetical protein
LLALRSRAFSRCSITPKNEDLMRKITLTLAAAALVFGSLAVANAQTQALRA